jgi:hypothetical protein
MISSLSIPVIEVRRSIQFGGRPSWMIWPGRAREIVDLTKGKRFTADYADLKARPLLHPRYGTDFLASRLSGS